jgi:opacity protein-like surface antigen
MSLATGAFHGIAIAVDYLLEMTLFWKQARPMTVSSRAGLALRAGETTTPLALIGRALNKIDPSHTDAAIAADISRAKSALQLLGG